MESRVMYDGDAESSWFDSRQTGASYFLVHMNSCSPKISSLSLKKWNEHKDISVQ